MNGVGNEDKQLFVLRRLFNSGGQLNTHDMELLRRACKERVDAAAGDRLQRVQELNYALQVIEEIPIGRCNPIREKNALLQKAKTRPGCYSIATC